MNTILLKIVIYCLKQITDDGKLPRTICPPCNLQLHSTKAFLDHVVGGQQKLRELWKQQVSSSYFYQDSYFHQCLLAYNISLNLKFSGGASEKIG